MNPDAQYQQPQQNPGQAAPPPAPSFQPVNQPQPPSQPIGYPSAPVSEQRKHRPWGLIIALIVFVLGFLGSSGFAFWAYAEMQDYKNNVDEKVAAAVSDAVKQTESTKEKEFLERSKSPYKKYESPATFGAVEVTYPKTWAATVDEQGGGSALVSGYFHPDFVPGPKSGTAFALRLEVMKSPYDKVLGTYDSDAKKGSVKVKPFKAKRVPAVLGARVDGEIEKGMQGSAVLIPLRDKTIRISTLAYKSYGSDFEKVVLENLIFTP